MAVVAASSDGLNIAVIAKPATALRSELTTGIRPRLPRLHPNRVMRETATGRIVTTHASETVLRGRNGVPGDNSYVGNPWHVTATAVHTDVAS